MMTNERECRLICGVDEAGRGPLCGPVFAAAVILDPARPIEGIADSKKLKASTRERLTLQIQEQALAWAVAQASVEEIDQLNILHATMLAMRRAIMALKRVPDEILIDGNRCPVDLPCPARAVVKGDVIESSISAASILAKTARDAFMCELDRQYPQYRLASHKGYPTVAHLAALQQYGIAPFYRRSFAPVRALIEKLKSVSVSEPS